MLGGLRACRWGRTPARQARALFLFRTFLNVLELAKNFGLLRLRLRPSGFAFGLRLRASPSFGPARSHGSSHNPWAMPGVVPGFPTKHPRHTAVVFAAEHRRAAFSGVSCAIFCCCCVSPRRHPGRVPTFPGGPGARPRSCRKGRTPVWVPSPPHARVRSRTMRRGRRSHPRQVVEEPRACCPFLVIVIRDRPSLLAPVGIACPAAVRGLRFLRAGLPPVWTCFPCRGWCELGVGLGASLWRRLLPTSREGTSKETVSVSTSQLDKKLFEYAIDCLLIGGEVSPSECPHDWSQGLCSAQPLAPPSVHACSLDHVRICFRASTRMGMWGGMWDVGLHADLRHSA